MAALWRLTNHQLNGLQWKVKMRKETDEQGGGDRGKEGDRLRLQ